MDGVLLDVTAEHDPGRARSRGVMHSIRAPHRQVAALVVLNLILGAGVWVFYITGVGSARTPISQTQDRLLVASEGLTQSKLIVSDLALKYMAALPTPPADRTAAVAALTAEYSQFSSAYAGYEKDSVDLPGAAALQNEMRNLKKQQGDISVALLGVPEVSAAQVIQYATVALAMEHTLEKLNSLYSAKIAANVDVVASSLETTQTRLLVAVAIVVFLLLTTAFFVVRSIRRSSFAGASQARRNDLETRLHRALEMARDETGVYAIVEDALDHTVPELRAEMLVADSSRAHLHQVLVTRAADTDTGCPVASPGECPAARRGQTQVFRSSEDLDACPHLKQRAAGPCAAVCIPVSIAGYTVGIIHAVAADEDPPAPDTVETLELVARKAGERVGMLRAFARSETQAHTDPLTGLLNRRSLEAQTHELGQNGTQYVVAYGDLDHFKMLNDVHGHDTGDKALRLFARVLRDNVRPSDIPARYGGEEFVAVLPECSIADAVTVLERVRQQLAAAEHSVGGPTFTVSFGLASSVGYATFSETLEAADAALLVAKASGRDRIQLADGPEFPPQDETEPPLRDARSEGLRIAGS
jgi:diguanylate cyclase (GGDEF)-like protein